jgi:integrase
MANDADQKIEYEQVGEFVRIFPRAGKWHVNFQHAGKQQRQSLKTASKKEARRRALRIERDLVTGEFKLARKAPTIESVITQYMAYLRGENRAAKTLTKYRKVFDRVIDLAGRIRRRNILGIDLGFLDTFRQERTAAGRSPKTIYGESIIIRQLVNFARSRRLISTDPLQGAKIREPKPTPQPCWSPAQVEQILAVSKGPQRVAFTILAETGLRAGELKWLTWADVDLGRNVLHVRPKTGWKPKTGDQRAVPISPRVRDCLDSLPRHASWVLTAAPSAKHPSGDRQMSERRLLRSLKRVLRMLNLPGHLHTFRHAFISKALASGIPESQVRAWVGHVDDQIIRLYTHIADSQSQAAMGKLAATNGGFSNFSNKEVAHGQINKEVESAQTQHNHQEPSHGEIAN